MLKGGTVVNQDGTASAISRCRDGRIAAIGYDRRRQGRHDHRCPGSPHPSRRHRHPGAFPRAGPRAQGGPRERQPRRRAGRRHRRVRDAEHQAGDDDAPRHWPTRSRARAGACTATSPSTSAATRENIDEIPELERLEGSAGIKVFMGSSTGDLLVDDDASLDRIIAQAAPPRRLSRRGRAAPQGAHGAAACRRPDLAPRVARRDGGADRDAAPRRPRREAREARAHPARVDRGGDAVPCRAQGLGQRRGHAASSHAGGARLLPRARRLCADEPAGARRARIGARCGRRSAPDSSTCWAPITRRTRARKRTTRYPATHSGMTGVQTLVPIMLDHVNAGRLTLERFVDLTSHGPQRLFGIRGKGRIADGYDADLTVVDLKRARRSRTSGSPAAAAGRPTTGARSGAGRSARSCAAPASCGTARYSSPARASLSASSRVRAGSPNRVDPEAAPTW